MPSPRATGKAVCPSCGRTLGCYMPTVQAGPGPTTFHMREHTTAGRGTPRCPGGQSIVTPIEGTTKKD